MPRFVLGQHTDAGPYFHITPELLTPNLSLAKVFEVDHLQRILDTEKEIGHLNLIMDLDTQQVFPFTLGTL